jgi:hypothetical protein
MLGLTAALIVALGACDDPTGPADEIAGEYELTARVENEVETPVTPSDDGAVLVLRPDRTWLLTRHRSGARVPGEGFGLTDRYSFESGAPELALTMFSEGPFVQLLAGSARVHGDTLRWGAEVFVRR